MEKFYMEDNNNKKGKQGVITNSVILSFVVAIVAIISIAVTGITSLQRSGVSYAAPTELPDSFTFNLLNGGDIGDQVVGSNDTDNKVFTVPMYVANNDPNTPIFCVEHAEDVVNNTNYTKVEGEGTKVDNGLIYILNNSYANGVKITDATGENASYVEAWATQVAIWMYLYEKDAVGDDVNSPNYLTPDEISGIKNATKLIKYDKDRVAGTEVTVYSGTNIYKSFVEKLVGKALNVSDVAELKVTKASDEIKLTSDKKFYDSAEITVTGEPSSSLKSYSITLKGIDGAKAIDETGKELTTNVPAGTKFFVRIPAEKVTKEVQNVVVTVDGLFTTLEGKYYTGVAEDENGEEVVLQKVVSVQAGEKTISNGTEIKFVGTDDTGMSTVQTIYFIGLIVLLCGVGIVYANAKPVQVKQ